MKKSGLLLIFLIALLVTFSGCSKKFNDFEKNNRENNIANKKEEGKENVIEESEIDNNMNLVLIEYANIFFPEEINNKYPVIYSVISNSTTKTIIGYKRGMIAFDQFGEPLELYWNGMDSSSEKSFLYSYDVNNIEILSGKKIETEWSLFNLQDESKEQQYKEIKYVLYVFEEITFDDGTVWKNSNYQNWIDTLCGKKVDLPELDKYYPYIQYMD